jgi:hypothetical protein
VKSTASVCPALSLKQGDRPWKTIIHLLQRRTLAPLEQGKAGRREATSPAEPRYEESTVRHLGIEVDGAIEIADKIDI